MTLMKFIMTALIVMAFAGNIYANDTSGTILPNKDLRFEITEGISMVVEALHIDGDIEVNYIFENTTDKDIETTVIFPLSDMRFMVNDSGENRYSISSLHTQGENDGSSSKYGFKLWVNGEKKNYNTNMKVMSDNSADEYYWVNGQEKKNDNFILKSVDVTDYFASFYGNSDNPNAFDAFVAKMSKKDIAYLVDNDVIVFGALHHWAGTPDNEVEGQEYGWTIKHDLKVTESYYWKQIFPAKKRVHIKHKYSPSVFRNSIAAPELIDREWNDKDGCWYYKYKDKDERIGTTRGEVYGFAGEGEYILTTANSWQRPIKYFNLFVTGVADFEDKIYFSPKDGFIAKNIKDFTPTKELSFETAFKAKTNLDDPNRTYIGERLKDEFKNIALYGIDGPANVRETPNGKVIGSIENGAYVWVLLKKGDWYKIAYNNLTGWTHKKNLVDVWDVKKYNENKGND